MFAMESSPRKIVVLSATVSLEHLRLEEPPPADVASGDHEDAIAAVVKSLRILRRSRHVRLHHFPDEEAAPADERAIEEAALEVGEAFRNERRLHFRCADGRESE